MIKRNEHIEKINELIDDENYHEIGDTVEGYIQEIEDKIQDALKELNDINGIENLGNVESAADILNILAGIIC